MLTFWIQFDVYLNFKHPFPVIQEPACPVGDEEEAGGERSAVHSERRDAHGGSGFGQAGLGKGVQQGKADTNTIS